MKRDFLGGVVIGTVAGLAAALIWTGGHDKKTASSENGSLPGSGNTSKKSTPDQTQLILDAMEVLDQTTAELKDARKTIAELERETRRYNWLTDYWKENGTGSSWALNLSYRDAPNKKLVDFMGWDTETAELVESIGQVAQSQIEAWESANAIKIEPVEPGTVWEVEIPPVPDEIISEYYESMHAVLSPEDYALLETTMQKAFESTTQPRIVTMKYIDPPIGAPANPASGDAVQWIEYNERVVKEAGIPGFGRRSLVPPLQELNPWIHLSGED